jgi:hypothetical protein
MGFQIVKLTDPIQFTTIDGGLVPRGAYNAGTDYAVGDSVDYNGSSYVMFSDAGAGTLPTDTTKWQVLANKGATGAAGAAGADGADGADGAPGVVQSIVAGTNVTVDATDPANPIVNSTASGTGDVVGPASATDNAIARYDSTTGKLIQDSLAILDDVGSLTLPDTGILNVANYTGTDTSPNFNAYGRDAATGTAGSISFYGGIGTAGNANGGDVLLSGGSGDGSGTDGVIKLFQSNTPFKSETLDLTSLTDDRTVTFPDKDGTIAYLDDITGGSGITRSITVTSGNVTAGATASTDYVYLVAGAHTITLPTAVGNTNRYTIKNNHSANITVDTTSSQTIDGTTTISIAPEDAVDIISNNSNWYII